MRYTRWRACQDSLSCWTRLALANEKKENVEQSGKSVNLRTPSCHGKKARCGDAIVRVVSRSISAENLPKWMSKLSSRVEGHERSLAELSFFFIVEIEPSSQMNSANPTAESSSCDLRDEMARRMRPSLKTGGSIQAFRVSETRR